MLRCLDLKAAAVARPLLDAATVIATKGAVPAADDFCARIPNGGDSCGRRAMMMPASPGSHGHVSAARRALRSGDAR
jgi:hypothetical protein